MPQPDQTRRRLWHEALRRTVDAIAGLTAVDGAVVLTDQHELLGFGAKLAQAARLLELGLNTDSEFERSLGGRLVESLPDA